MITYAPLDGLVHLGLGDDEGRDEAHDRWARRHQEEAVVDAGLVS